MRTWWISLALLACSAPRESLPNNVSSSSSVRIGPTDPLGWLGFATAVAHGDTVPGHAPINADHPLVVDARAELPATVSAIATTGEIQKFTTGSRAKIPYGCDGNEIDVTTLMGPRITPGVVWILPPAHPTSWRPSALAISSRTSTPALRSYAIGPLAVELTRTADLRGTLTIRREGHTVHTTPFERQVMDGADASPIDLTEGGPGIPEPIAAWSIAESGPILLVLTQPGYEGMTLRPRLIEATSSRPVESMETYLYHCAF